uniref:Uncharacterized protein n=1 Tax=Plectus sambesii TaxID=2011161 RepID=A0A914W1W2_9BILA
SSSNHWATAHRSPPASTGTLIAAAACARNAPPPPSNVPPGASAITTLPYRVDFEGPEGTPGASDARQKTDRKTCEA